MFDQLPAELYESILSHVPSSELQQTLLSVTRAIPLSPVPISRLFRHICITYPARAIRLYRRLRPNNPGNEAADLVKEFSIACWSVDADVVVNLIRLLPKLQTLNIWIGPNNFTPEHLEELFLKPFWGLKHLSLRFRPYVQKATYYQFLKGAYFDSTLLAISRWPTVTLSSLSIIQEPVEPQKQSFAQPLVFFRLDPGLSILIHSTALSSLTSLLIQLPGRPVVRSLCTAATYSKSGNLLVPPDLVFLDLSTCSVLEGELDTLLVYFSSLQHIILDGCAILRGNLHDGEIKALGKRCALVGVRRAREREKMLKSWLGSRVIPHPTEHDTGSNGPARKAKPGRRGLSTSTISFRIPSTLAMSDSTFSIPEGNVPTSKKVIQKIRILPPMPCLRSLSVTVPASITADDYPLIRVEFESGWAEGITQLVVTRDRMRTSAGNRVRVMRVKSGIEDSDEEGLEGLVDIGPDDFKADSSLEAPVLCFAGANPNGHHQGSSSGNWGAAGFARLSL